MQELGPDDAVTLPAREAQAALSLIERLHVALSNEPTLASDVATALPPLSADAVLPEVGTLRDDEHLLLHLRRLAERLRNHVPSSDPELKPITSPRADSEFRTVTLTDALYDDEDADMLDAFVWWDDIDDSDVTELQAVLNAATDERPLQRHLATHPALLVQHLGGGHGRWVISQKRLGSEYVTDFVIGHRNSGGRQWQFVELQSPRARLFVPSTGRLSPQLDEGVKQILDWRRWLEDNRDYARRRRSHNGLGLEDVSSRDGGLILIGRADELDDNARQRRRQLRQELNIEIHTYDWLIREAASRVDALERHRSNDRSSKGPAPGP
jgi:hypothetical protein